MPVWSRLAVVLALVAPSVGGLFAAAHDEDGRNSTGHAGDELVATARVHAATSPSMPERPWRNVLAPAAGVAAAFTLGFFVPTGLIGRRFRRLDDVGDAWRSLLEGAPPALS